MLGLVIGTSAYRSGYAALLDFRYNDIPMPLSAVPGRFSYFPCRRPEVVYQTRPQKTSKSENLAVRSWWAGMIDRRHSEKTPGYVQVPPGARTIRPTSYDVGSRSKPDLLLGWQDVFTRQRYERKVGDRKFRKSIT
jgi:hypothetical protein